MRETARFHLGDALFERAAPQLSAMGEIATARETLALSMRAESEPPQHVAYSPWGERIDEIRVSSAYTELGKIGVQAGVTALPYEKEPFAEQGRVVWAALMCMWGPSSALYSCPIAMTDAAARTLLEHGDVDDIAVVGRLTSRDPELAWTSGQWMTEMTGGSDVSRTSTRATRDEDGNWRLYGTKWFTSATTADMALTLARPDGGADGSGGLVLFRVHRFLEDGSRNAILVRRLKDKLGTRALPTAELELQGALAQPVGEPVLGTGIRRIATMLNLTRIHNALGATGGMGRGLSLARAYASVRHVFGRQLSEWPAHRATLADLAVDYAAALALTFRSCQLMGRVEAGNASDDERAVLRGLTPIAKLATARWAVATAAEVMEAIGGVAYCEDSGVPAAVRNAHVLPIWEGTTNVLSLDLLRAQQKEGAVSAVLADARATVQATNGEAPREQVLAAIGELESRMSSFEDVLAAQASARAFAMSLARTYACARLCSQGTWAAESGDRRTLLAAERLVARGLMAPPPSMESLDLAMDEEGTVPELR